MLFASAVRGEVTEPALQTGIHQAISKVDAFESIASMARQRGLKLYLFGGTASTFANYVKWDLERSADASKFLPHRFDYHYTNIFRSNQDLDVVITRADGGAESIEQIQEFQKALEEGFPYFRGNQTAWEVRGLRTANGAKEALLNNPDFSNQNTDSHSTGLIELTDGRDDFIQDLRDPGGEPPRFLKDVSAGRVTFYRSPKHFETKRAKEGLNPEIIGAIRYLTKLLQVDGEMDATSRAHIEQVVREFDPKAERNSYVSRWVEKNAKKLFQNAVDLEAAWNLLEDLGLRQKLLEFNGNPQVTGSLSWWMNKEPLRSIPHPNAYPLVAKESTEEKRGKTAGELGITTVAHQTRHWESYEAITNSPGGKPNLFTSRDGKEGEAAVHGDGFYTLVGEKGAPRGGFTIRFSVDPAAVEGEDFLIHDGIVVWRKSNHLSVQPESVFSDPIQAAELLIQSDTTNEKGLEKRLQSRFAATQFSEEDIKRIQQFFLEVLMEKPMLNYQHQGEVISKIRKLGDLFPTVPFSSEFEQAIIALAERERGEDADFGARALVQVRYPSETVKLQLLKLIESEHSSVVSRVLENLHEVHLRDSRFVDALIKKTFESDHSWHRGVSARKLAEVSYLSEATKGRVIGLLDNSDQDLQRAAIDVLSIHSKDDTRFLAKLIELLDHESPRVVVRAQEAIKDLGLQGKEFYLPLVPLVKYSPGGGQHRFPDKVNEKAISLLMERGIEIPEVVEELARTLREDRLQEYRQRDWLSQAHYPIMLVRANAWSDDLENSVIERLHVETELNYSEALLEAITPHLREHPRVAYELALAIALKKFRGNRDKAWELTQFVVPNEEQKAYLRQQIEAIGDPGTNFIFQHQIRLMTELLNRTESSVASACVEGLSALSP